jgi:nucleotidyltransferase/DNA polymerase involved in DNA repair
MGWRARLIASSPRSHDGRRERIEREIGYQSVGYSSSLYRESRVTSFFNKPNQIKVFKTYLPNELGKQSDQIFFIKIFPNKNKKTGRKKL